MLALETRLETMAQQALELVKKSMEALRMAAIEVSREQGELEPVELLLLQMIGEERTRCRRWPAICSPGSLAKEARR